MLGILKGSVRVPAKARLSGHLHSSLSAMVLMTAAMRGFESTSEGSPPWGGSSPPWGGSFQPQWTAAESSGDPVGLPSGTTPLADLGPGVL